MEKKFKIFGAALDPTDSEAKILIKQNVLDAKSTGRKLKSKYEDPYEGFLTESKILQRSNMEPIGRFPVESWLRPKPAIGDEIFMTPLDFRLFLDSNGCQDYAVELERFVVQRVFPENPFMIGADHSLTGGVLRAVSKRYGPENLSVIIFDGHFDAIPTPLRLALAKYVKDHQKEIAVPFPEMIDSITPQMTIPASYNCGTFLNTLLEEGTILPQNLVVYGAVDYPSLEMQSIEDPRVREFVNCYLAFEEKGVSIVPNSKDSHQINQTFEKALRTLKTPYTYLSIDVDVSALNAVLAARLMEFIGLDFDIILEAGGLLRQFFSTSDCELIGLDVMEVEIHFLNAQLKSGKKDRTITLIDQFLELLPIS
ncbi:MAG: arginase family protein [Candidatus Helarchaeota archaeon]